MTEDQQKQIEREFADAKTPGAYRLAQDRIKERLKIEGEDN